MMFASDFGIRTISFSVSQAELHSWEVDVRIAFSDGAPRNAGMVIETSLSPLQMQEARYDGAEPSPWSGIESSRRGILLRPTENRDSGDGELILRMRWEAATRIPDARFIAPCLVIPDMLPRLISTAGLRGPRAGAAQPILELRTPLPDGLDAGGISLPDRKGRPTSQFLQLVIFPTHNSDVGTATVAVTNLDKGTADSDAVIDYVAPLTEFVSTDLKLNLPVRSVIALASSPDGLFPTVGAYCALDPEDIGARRRNVGKPLTAVRLLSQAWFSGGIRIIGENADYLALGLGGMMGLRFLERVGEQEYLQQLISEAEETARKQSESLSDADRVKVIEARFFQGIQSSDKARKKLGKMVADRWGTFVSQAEIISMLRKNHVSVPYVFE